MQTLELSKNLSQYGRYLQKEKSLLDKKMQEQDKSIFRLTLQQKQLKEMLTKRPLSGYNRRLARAKSGEIA